jgi:hypothetical protein
MKDEIELYLPKVMPHRSRMMLRGCYATPSEQQRCLECPEEASVMQSRTIGARPGGYAKRYRNCDALPPGCGSPARTTSITPSWASAPLMFQAA